MITVGYDLHKDDGVSLDMTRKRDIYLAGPFFNPQQEEEMSRLESILSEAELTFFSPRLECRYRSKTDPPVFAQRAFALNRFHIRGCDLVVASLTCSDVGTSWELGFADAMDVPRLGVVCKDPGTVNLMVRGTVDNLINLDELASEVQTFFGDVAQVGKQTARMRMHRRAKLTYGSVME